jgi:hypothetical protein
MGSLPVTLYGGDLYDKNTAAIVPRDVHLLPAIWAFCSSPEFNQAVRSIDRALKSQMQLSPRFNLTAPAGRE